MTPPRGYVSAGTAARKLGTTDRTIRRWVEDGSMPFHVLDGRIWILSAEVERRVTARKLAERIADMSDTRSCPHCGQRIPV